MSYIQKLNLKDDLKLSFYQKIFVLIALPVLFVTISNNLRADEYDELRQHSKAVMITHNHDIMKSFTGKYRQIFFFTPPEAKTMNGAGKSENNIILNERYLEINSDLMFGTDTLARKMLIGFDGMKQKYQLFQYTNIETFPLLAEGFFDDENKSLVFTGTYPYKEINSADFKIVFKYVSPDEFTYLFYEIENNKESKILEIRNYKLSD